MQRVLSAGFCFRGAYLATRIPCNTYGRKEAITWIGSREGRGGSREPFEALFCSCFLVAVAGLVTRVDTPRCADETLENGQREAPTYSRFT